MTSVSKANIKLPSVQSSNNSIPSHIPASPIAVFVGGTTGIGAATIKALAKHAPKPTIYIVGRSEASAEKVIAESRSLNNNGTYEYVKGDVSSTRGADTLSEEIKKRLNGRKVNFLVLSPMIFDFKSKTPDGLSYIAALGYYSRMRLIHNFLPHLTQPARVISIAAGALEGPLNPDFASTDLPRNQLRAHLSTLTTLGLEAFAAKTPQGENVTFIQTFPGVVPTEIFNGIPGLLGVFFRLYITVLGWLGLVVKVPESGDRNLWLLTSARFPAKEGGESGVPVDEKIGVAVGTDGEVGSGVYSLEWDGTAAGEKSIKILKDYRQDGTAEKVWEDLQKLWERTTG